MHSTGGGGKQRQKKRGRRKTDGREKGRKIALTNSGFLKSITYFLTKSIICRNSSALNSNI
jgi:hypothetical protein